MNKREKYLNDLANRSENPSSTRTSLIDRLIESDNLEVRVEVLSKYYMMMVKSLTKWYLGLGHMQPYLRGRTDGERKENAEDLAQESVKGFLLDTKAEGLINKVRKYQDSSQKGERRKFRHYLIAAAKDWELGKLRTDRNHDKKLLNIPETKENDSVVEAVSIEAEQSSDYQPESNKAPITGDWVDLPLYVHNGKTTWKSEHSRHTGYELIDEDDEKTILQHAVTSGLLELMASYAGSKNEWKIRAWMDYWFDRDKDMKPRFTIERIAEKIGKDKGSVSKAFGNIEEKLKNSTSVKNVLQQMKDEGIK